MNISFRFRYLICILKENFDIVPRSPFSLLLDSKMSLPSSPHVASCSFLSIRHWPWVECVYLSDVESICISLQGICGVWQIEVQSGLLQHLLVPILVVLTMGSETTVVAPVFFNGNLKMSQNRGEFHTTQNDTQTEGLSGVL